MTRPRIILTLYILIAFPSVVIRSVCSVPDSYRFPQRALELLGLQRQTWLRELQELSFLINDNLKEVQRSSLRTGKRTARMKIAEVSLTVALAIAFTNASCGGVADGVP